MQITVSGVSFQQIVEQQEHNEVKEESDGVAQ
jgi:hypothetical protein